MVPDPGVPGACGRHPSCCRRSLARRSPSISPSPRERPLTTLLHPPDDAAADADRPRTIVVNRSRGDRIYRGTMKATGALSLVVMAAIGTFLTVAAVPAIGRAGASFLTTVEWQPDTAEPSFGVVGVLLGTFKAASVAMVIAVPLSVGCALFITEYASGRLRQVLVSLVDLLAAVPSLIFALWGFDTAQPVLIPVAKFLDDRFGFIPLFHAESREYYSSYFIGGCVLALMCLPIGTSVMRQVFALTPQVEKEGALALGGTRWGMIRDVVLPFGRGGIIGGSMLALGRALAEAIVMAIILLATVEAGPSLVDRGGSTIASLIARSYYDAKDMGISALMAAGLVLFVVTLVVNVGATVIVSRSRSGAGVEL